ncbi:MAG: hypothetical protein KBS75_00450 [Bacteroidales bacterium]|nr:hypothetical protein [Candidatus Equimonas faecalis]
MSKSYIVALAFALIMAVASCARGNADRDSSSSSSANLVGMWVLIGEEGTDSVADSRREVHTADSYDILKAYEPDGMCYKFIGNTEGSRDTYLPTTKETYTLQLSAADTLYAEGKTSIRLCSLNDSVMVIEWEGALQTWRRLADFPQSRRLELEAVARDLMGASRSMHEEYYVGHFIHTRHQLSWLTHLLIALGAIVLVGCGLLLHFFRRKRQLERALADLRREISERPPVITQATEAARDELYESAWYQGLCQRLARGESLSADDWSEVAHQVRRIYPNFRSRLYDLCRLSDIEFRVCLLIKLHIAPADIATALCREKSTISTVRSRLYAKVFGRKGSSREWDDFIETL